MGGEGQVSYEGGERRRGRYLYLMSIIKLSRSALEKLRNTVALTGDGGVSQLSSRICDSGELASGVWVCYNLSFRELSAKLAC